MTAKYSVDTEIKCTWVYTSFAMHSDGVTLIVSAISGKQYVYTFIIVLW